MTRAAGNCRPRVFFFGEILRRGGEILEGDASCDKLYWSKTVMELRLNRRISLTVS